MRIFYLSPSNPFPSGGVKQIYRHVEILSSCGIPAYVLHDTPNFQCRWFKNQVPIAHLEVKNSLRFMEKVPFFRKWATFSFWGRSLNLKTPLVLPEGRSRLSREDVLVVPEFYGKHIQELISPDLRFVIFNQGHYLTFRGYSYETLDEPYPYQLKHCMGVLASSQAIFDYICAAFPEQRVKQVKLGISKRLFFPEKKKEQLITYSSYKGSSYLPGSLISLLRLRLKKGSYQIVGLKGLSEEAMAQALRQSSIYLSMARQEGFGLPAAEAMACGCLVVGSHGDGGREFFSPDHSFPIPQNDLLQMSQTVEELVAVLTDNEQAFDEKRDAASRFILENYSLDRERDSVLKAWEEWLPNIQRGYQKIYH